MKSRRLVLRVYAFAAALSIVITIALLVLPRYARGASYLEPHAALLQHMVDRWSLKDPSKFAEGMARIAPRLRGKLSLYDHTGKVEWTNTDPPLEAPNEAEVASLHDEKWALATGRIVVRSDDNTLLAVYHPNRPGFPWGYVVPMALGILLVVGAASIWFSRRLARPLDQLARANMKVWRELLERRWGAVTPADAAAWTEARVIGPASGFLEGLDLPESHRLRALLWELPAGMLIVRAGEASNRFLIVTQGRVDVTAADGTPLVDAGPGDMPGVLAVIDGGRQPFSFIAREPTIAAVIDADRFRELRYGGSQLAAKLVPLIHSYLVERYRPLLDTILGGDDDETMVDAELP